MLATSQEAEIALPQARRGMSRRVSFWSVCWATVRKDLQIEWRYAPDLIGRLVELAMRVAVFLMFSNVLSIGGVSSLQSGTLSGHNLFLFLQGSLLLLVFNGTALSTPVNSVGRDLTNGTLEFLYSGPSPRYAYFVGTVVASALINLVFFVPLYLFLVVSSGAPALNLLKVLVVCMLTLVSLVAMGVMIALLAVLWRQSGSITTLIGLLFEFLAGAYFPISVLPEPLRVVSYLLPYTWSYDLIRYYSFDGQWTTAFPVTTEWLVLLVYAVLFTLLSRVLLRKTERQAKKNGLHLL